MKEKLCVRLRTCFVALFVIAILILGLGSQLSFAQTEKASVSGRVTDQNNAVVPDVEVQIRNTDTDIVTSMKTNAEGIYVIPSLNPGNYVMTITKQGFRAVSVTGVTLNVQDNLSRNFVLQVGSIAESVTVTAEAGQELVQSTTSDVGTVISQKAIHDLPLDGRNFSQLLTLTPGATPVSTSQSNQVAVNDLGVLGVPTSSFSQPSIQGQYNRTNLYLLDGVVNTELGTSTYIIPPIIDSMQEFKVQSHDDEAEFGSVLGGVVNVLTRSGSNQIHGAAWEFLRNNVLDARDYFKDVNPDGSPAKPAAFRQNQFGAMFSGPVLLPKLYNGRNRTFFTFAYEGWRFSQASQVQYTVPTDAELAGDFSNATLTNPIFDPATSPRTPFVASSDPASANYNSACTSASGCPNMIPTNRIDTTMLKFIQSYYARPNFAGPGILNAIATAPHVDTSDHYNFRIDEQLGSKDNIFFRYDRLNVVDVDPFDVSGAASNSVPALNIGVGWTHTFNSSLLLENHVGRTQRPFVRSQTDKAGIGPMQALGFTSPGGTTISLAAPFGGGVLADSPGLNLDGTIESPVTSDSNALMWIHGGHQFKFGFQYFKQGNNQGQPPYGKYVFTDDTTANPGVGGTGSSLASALLGLPSETDNTATVAVGERVSTWATYVQDSWKVRRNFTLNYGVRFDHRRPFDPDAGTVVSGPNIDGHWWIGSDQLPPPCTQAGVVPPCIPGGGTLASIPSGNFIQLSPYGKAWGPAPDWSDWGPRLGFAWQVSDKMVVRAGYGIAYDPLTGWVQDWKGIANSWPATGGVFNNTSLNQIGQPLTTVEQTFGQSASLALPAASPWTQDNWFMDPHMKDPRSQQWNLEIQRQMGTNLALSVGYVGSHDTRLSSTGLWNTAQTPGLTTDTPAQINARRPFPWYDGTPFYSTSTGNSTYNALELKLEHRFANSFQYLVSYTWSKSIDQGSSGFFGVENGPGAGGDSNLQNYYDPRASRGVSSYNIPQFLSMTGVWDLPFGKGKRYLKHGVANQVAGNWQVNGVVQLRSGQPYNLAVPTDSANIGNESGFWDYARPNVIGNPNPAHQRVNEWFNPAAFAVPVDSYGDFGRNALRSAPVYDADFSVFKNFPVGERLLVSFRAEFFNVFNIQNYNVPNNLIGVAGAGQITSNVLPPREIQFGLHVSF